MVIFIIRSVFQVFHFIFEQKNYWSIFIDCQTGSLSAPPPPSQYRQYGTKQTEIQTFAQPHINESAGLNGTTIIEEDR